MIASGGGLERRERWHSFGGHRIAADAPLATAHFLDRHPGHRAQFLALDRYHRVGQLLDHLTFLLFVEYTLNQLDFNQRHLVLLFPISFSLGDWSVLRPVIALAFCAACALPDARSNVARRY